MQGLRGPTPRACSFPVPSSFLWLILLGAWNWHGSLPTPLSKMGRKRCPRLQELSGAGLWKGISGVCPLPGFHPTPQRGFPVGPPWAEGLVKQQLVCDLAPVVDGETEARPGASMPSLVTEYLPCCHQMKSQQLLLQGSNSLTLSPLLNTRNSGPRRYPGRALKGMGRRKRPVVTIYTRHLLAKTHTASKASNLLRCPWPGSRSSNQPSARLPEASHTHDGLELVSLAWDCPYQ